MTRPSVSPAHASLDVADVGRYFDRLDVEEDGFGRVLLRARQQRMDLDPTARVDEERVRQPFQMEVDDLAEERVDLQVGARHALELAQREDGQAFGNYQSCRRRPACGYVKIGSLYLLCRLTRN